MKRLFLQVCAHVEADGRPGPGALAAAFVRTHVEAYGRTFTGTPYLQTDGCARPYVQWCVADGAVRPDVPADASAHGEPDDRAGARADVRTHRCADAVALRCADQQTVLHSDGCPERTAEPAAFFEAHIRTDVKTNDATLCQADRVERAPLNIVCLVSPPSPPPPPLP